MSLRPGIAVVLALGVLLLFATGARAAVPVCTSPAAQTTPYGTSLFLDGAEFCSDADGDSLSFEVVTLPGHGTVAGSPEDGMFEYRPSKGFSGADSFALKAKDGSTESNTVTVQITVEANHPPECPPDFSFDAEPGQATTFDPVLSFDSEDDAGCWDPEYAELSFKIAQAPAHGTLSEYQAGSGFSYRPNAGYAGPDSFTFRASDGAADSDLVTARITVLPPNHAPSCVTPFTLHIGAGEAAQLGPLGRPFTCSDPDGDRLFPELISGPAHGSFSLPVGTLVYTPDPGFRGTDEIRYRVSDPRGARSNVATLLIVVAPPTTSVAAPGPTNTQTRDTTRPVVGMRALRGQDLTTLRTRGLRLRLASSEACTVRIAVSVTRRVARGLGLQSRLLGSTRRAVPTGRAIVVIRLTRKARRALRRATKLRLQIEITATDALGNHRTSTRRLTVRR